jgi:hypothetical protein
MNSPTDGNVTLVYPRGHTSNCNDNSMPFDAIATRQTQHSLNRVIEPQQAAQTSMPQQTPSTGANWAQWLLQHANSDVASIPMPQASTSLMEQNEFQGNGLAAMQPPTPAAHSSGAANVDLRAAAGAWLDVYVGSRLQLAILIANPHLTLAACLPTPASRGNSVTLFGHHIRHDKTVPKTVPLTNGKTTGGPVRRSRNVCMPWIMVSCGGQPQDLGRYYGRAHKLGLDCRVV